MTTRYVDSAAAGANNGTGKTDAYTTFAAAIAAMAAGDTILVNSTHVEPTNSSGATVTLTIPGTISARSKIVSVNFSNDVPTQGAALYTTTGATPLTVNGAFRIYGCNLLVGSGAVTAALTLAKSAASAQLWESCNLTIVATGTSSNIAIGDGSTNGHMICQWSNVTATFGATGQGFSISYATIFSWRNDSGVAALGGATFPTNLLKVCDANTVRLRGLDLASRTIFGNGTNIGDLEVRNCRIDITPSANLPAIPEHLSGVDYIECKNGVGTVYSSRSRYQGSLATETTIVRTGGATDGTTPFSWKIIGSANNAYDSPFVAFEETIWNTTLAPITLSIHTVTDNITLTDAEAWVAAEYLSSASYPLTTIITDRSAGDPIPAAANQATSTEVWTTTGLTTPVKQKLNVTFTPAVAGLIRVKVNVARTSGTIYVCPKIEIA